MGNPAPKTLHPYEETTHVPNTPTAIEQTHRIAPLDLPRANMLALCGMDPAPEGGFKPLPTSSALELPQSARSIMLNEPALRVLRPAIDECSELALRQGVDIAWLALGVGEYEALPPEMLHHRMIAAPRHHEHYTRNARGDRDLLGAHADWLRMITGYDYHSEDILLTSGCLDACRDCILYLTDPGDEICFVEPHWINSFTMAVAYGRRCSEITLDWRNKYRKPQTWQEWDELVPESATVLWLEGQGNPTGFGWESLKEMEALAEFAERRRHRNKRFVVVVDEEYRLLYESLRPMTILSLGARGIVTLSSWDKTFCVTSLRLGSIESADTTIRSLLQPLGNLHLSAPDFMRAQSAVAECMRDRTQHGGLAYLCGLAQEIKANRDVADHVIGGSGIGTLIRGNTAFYNPWIVPELRTGGPVQAMMHTLFTIGNALREKRDPGIYTYTDAVPIAGFHHGGKGPSGFRLTLGRPESQGLRRALQGLVDTVVRYREAGEPYYGTPKQVVARFKKGEVITPKEWPNVA